MLVDQHPQDLGHDVSMGAEHDRPVLTAGHLDRAFEDLVRTHQHMVYGVALRVTANRADAEDVAQETFVRAYRALGSYDGERIGAMRLRPWLARIAVNLAKNKVKRQKRA